MLDRTRLQLPNPTTYPFHYPGRTIHHGTIYYPVIKEFPQKGRNDVNRRYHIGKIDLIDIILVREEMGKPFKLLR